MARWIPAILLAAAASGYAAAAPTTSADLYVAVDGDDRAAGSLEEPLKTIVAARNRARDLLADGTREVRVLIRGGTYFLDEPLVLDARDSAGPGGSVEYSAFPDEKVTLSGGRPIGNWRRDGNLLVADVPDVADGMWDFRELFVNGRRCVRARSPGYFRVVEAGDDERTSFQFAPGDLKRAWAESGDAELVFLHDWSISRVRIASIDEAERIVRLADPIGCNADHYRISHFEPHPRYFVENALQLLDEPGEWYLDKNRGQLMYLPREDETAESIRAVAPKLEQLLVVGGDEAKPVRGLHFSGIEFSHCRWPIPKHGYAEGQANIYEERTDPDARRRIMIPAAVTLNRAENCAFERCRFSHLGGAGVWLHRNCHNNRLIRSTIDDVAGNGVMIGQVDTRPDVSRGNEVTDCTIPRCGQLYFGAVGVWIGIAADTRIVHNEIRDLPYTGISVGWRWNTDPTPCRGHTIELNHIHRVAQTLSDGGGIYTLGRQQGTVLRRNRIHDIPKSAGHAESNGIFLDEGSSDILVDDNTIYDIAQSPIRIHRGREDTFRHNRLIIGEGVPSFRYNNASPETMKFVDNHIFTADSKWHPDSDDPTASAGPR